MPFGNTSLVVIASGSMSEKNEENTYLSSLNNQFNTYDIIGITKYDSQNDISLYDVVAFKNDEGITIVHRIIDIEEVNGEEVYITRGDANSVSDNGSQYDDYLHYENIIGYYNGTRIQSVGIFVVFLQSNAGIITIVAIAYCLIMFDYYSNKYDEAIKNRTDLLVNSLQYDLSNEENEARLIKLENLIYKNKLVKFVDGKYLYENSELTQSDLDNFLKIEEFVKSQEKVENCNDFNKNKPFQKVFQNIKEKLFEKKNSKENEKK